MRVRPRLVAATVLAALVGSLLTVVTPVGQAEEASAATASNFDPGFIVSDELFFDGDAMTAAQVQSFIDAKHPGCAAGYTCLDTYSQRTPSMSADAYCSAVPGRANESAASIIARVGAACDISQRYLLVLLEKEQSLVTHRSPNATRYAKATGFGCPDTAPCDSSVGGFFYQVYYGARQFQRYAAHPGNYNHRAGVVNNVLYNPNVACGSSPVLIRNVATAGLYNYTPYQPNRAALANLYGTGDGCSAYGNRNTWRMWTDWFGSPTQSKPSVKTPAFLRDSTTGRIFFIAQGKKHYVPSTQILAQYSALGSAVNRTTGELSVMPSGPDLGRTVRSSDGRMFLVDQSRLHHFQSCAQMQAWKISCTGVPQIDPEHQARLTSMGTLNSLVRVTDGSHWLVQSGTRRQVANPALLPQFGYSATPSEVSSALVTALPTGHPVVGAGDIVRSADRQQYRIVDANGRVYAAGAAHLGLRFLWDAPAFTLESLRLMPASGGTLPLRFSDAGGSWILAEGGALRVDPALYGGKSFFPAVSSDLRRALPAAGAATGPHFLRPVGSTTTYFVASGRATATTPKTFEWYVATFGVPRDVWVVARDGIEPIPQPSSFPDGSLIRSPAGAIYLMDNGNALHVANMDFVRQLGLPLSSTQVSSGIMAGLERRSGVLSTYGVRIGDRSYLAANGQLHPFASESVRAAWRLPEIALETLGSRLRISAQPVTQFVNDASGRVYLVEAGKRRPVSSVATLVQIGGASVPRITMPDSVLQRLPQGTWVRPALTSGTLLMADGRPEVWLVDGDRVVHLGAFATSISMGLGTSSTKLPYEAIATFARGPRMPSSLIVCGTTAYVAIDGALRPMSSQVRAQYPRSAFTTLGADLCGRLAVSPSPMTQFIRSPEGRIYYVEAGVRHWLGGPALTRLGGANRIVDVDRTVISAIPAGATWSN